MATRQEGDTVRNPESGDTEQSWGAWGWGSGGRRANGSPYNPGAQQDYQQQQQGYYQQQQRPVARGFFAPWDDRRGSWWPF